MFENKFRGYLRFVSLHSYTVYPRHFQWVTSKGLRNSGYTFESLPISMSRHDPRWTQTRTRIPLAIMLLCCLFSDVCLKTEYWSECRVSQCLITVGARDRSTGGAVTRADHTYDGAGDHKAPRLLSLRGNCPPPPHCTLHWRSVLSHVLLSFNN